MSAKAKPESRPMRIHKIPAKLMRGRLPAPVYVATFADKKPPVRMSFWSEVGKPLDFERGKRMCLTVKPAAKRKFVAGHVEYQGESFADNGTPQNPAVIDHVPAPIVVPVAVEPEVAPAIAAVPAPETPAEVSAVAVEPAEAPTEPAAPIAMRRPSRAVRVRALLAQIEVRAARNGDRIEIPTELYDQLAGQFKQNERRAA